MKITEISDLSKRCTGCMACMDICPKKCIIAVTDKNGFRYTDIENDKCVNCGKCYNVCPLNGFEKSTYKQRLYAAFSKDSQMRVRGSSGGIFEALAEYCIENGYYVCGAAFDNSLKLQHKIINDLSELPELLKSKYVQSDTTGIYEKIKALLKDKKKVFFCGTPCQVSALKKFISKEESQFLFTADIICHGVPSQTLFDEYIESLEKKNSSKILNFGFRVKNNRFRHAHGYSYVFEKDGAERRTDGIYTQSSFYNAFKNYLIFREGCYDCRYAAIERPGDITLGDFWGIEKYGFKGNTDKGVSMVILNTAVGEKFFNSIKERLIYKEFPVEYGIESNYCLRHSTVKPENYDEIFDAVKNKGYDSASEKYFSSGKSIKYRIYWLLPPFLRNILRKIRVKF